MMKAAEGVWMNCVAKDAAEKAKKEMEEKRHNDRRKIQMTILATDLGEKYQREHGRAPSFADVQQMLNKLNRKPNKRSTSSAPPSKKVEEKAPVKVAVTVPTPVAVSVSPLSTSVVESKEKAKRKLRSAKLTEVVQSPLVAEIESSIAKRLKRNRTEVKDDSSDKTADTVDSSVTFSNLEVRLLDSLNTSVRKLIDRTLSVSEMERLCMAYKI